MKVTKYIKGIVAAAALMVGTSHAVEATIAGTVPSVSYIIVNTEKFLDFSSPATDLTVAEILVTSNSANWAVDLSWDKASMEFNTDTQIYKNVKIIVPSALGGNGVALDASVVDLDWAVTSGVYGLDIGNGATTTEGSLECALWSAVAGPSTAACSGNTVYAANDVVRIGNVTTVTGAAFSTAFTSTTANGVIQVKASWDAGVAQTDYAVAYNASTNVTDLFAGSYSQVITAQIRTTL